MSIGGSSPSIEELMDRVRDEVKWRRTDHDEDVSPVDLNAPVRLPRLRTSLEERGDRFWLDDFLHFEDEEFVAEAYQRILGREADEDGFDFYCRMLKGEGSRLEVLAALARAPEARRRDVKVHGVRWRANVLRLYRFLPRPLRLFRARLQRGGQPPRQAERAHMDRIECILEQELTAIKRGMSQVPRDFERLGASLNAAADEVQRNRQEIAALADRSAELAEGLNETRRLLDNARGAIDALTPQVEENRGSVEGAHERAATLEAAASELREALSAANVEIERQQEILESCVDLSSRVPSLSRRINYHQRSREIFIREILTALVGEDRATDTRTEAVAETLEQHMSDKLEAWYVAFEDACRGEREDVRENFREYLPKVASVVDAVGEELPLIDIGCGRGEWLDVVREQGWKGLGIDTNRVMVDECQEEGLWVIQGDGLDYLRSLEDGSVALVSAFHVVEHLPFEQLYMLCEEAARVLAPGGAILFETPNPENVLVGSHTFYHDPTHRNPLTPTALEFLVTYCGFDSIEIERLHPYPESAKVPGDDPLTQRVNGHLCGPQDFAIFARVIANQ